MDDEGRRWKTENRRRKTEDWRRKSGERRPVMKGLITRREARDLASGGSERRDMKSLLILPGVVKDHVEKSG